MSLHGTAVSPAQALTAASQLTDLGETMLEQWRTVRARIEQLNAARPWGDDEPGRTFNRNYAEGEHPPCTSVLDAGQSMVLALARLGEQVREGVQGVVDLDDLTAAWFKP
ncbi:hypothetical protein ACQP00_05235 [Dactylosporangium sp. CS-047395]|uniref:hypothetical protein n=1 Tax=Dactylosporangium sp. CS-047395 TaxID=3239936 RepID=UPI003D8E8E11